MPLTSWFRAAGRGLRFLWDQTAGRYLGSQGKQCRAVPAPSVRDALDTALDASKEKLRTVTEGLTSGQVPLAEWQQTMADETKAVHTMAALAAVGGTEQLTDDVREALGETLTFHLGKLNDFAGELAAGTARLDGRAAQRAGLYADSAVGTYEDYRRAAEGDRGARFERRVLDPAAEHCASCEEAADEGWQPLGTLPRIGSLECGPRCRCSMEYSDGEDEPEE